MTTKQLPWGVHRISGIYSGDAACGLPNGRWVTAVSEPYTAGRLKAAWWVLTGRAYALQWPEPGDLEDALQDGMLTDAVARRTTLSTATREQP